MFGAIGVVEAVTLQRKRRDASGVQLTLTRNLREHDMGIVFGGAPTTAILKIPPKQSAFRVRVDVPLRLASSVNAFASIGSSA